MNRQELKEQNLKFKEEVKELHKKGIKVKDIATLKKITRARVYQIIGLKSAKKSLIHRIFDKTI